MFFRVLVDADMSSGSFDKHCNNLPVCKLPESNAPRGFPKNMSGKQGKVRNNGGGVTAGVGSELTGLPAECWLFL